ncbi:metallopeptidase family protein [Granulicoccus sp. GXG6511]|uniref:metallopeptidase family protein n=1 Tax=Granulicoccus sp. GXG6511 TaxID=3381351 RepID=UPI003D7E76D5
MAVAMTPAEFEEHVSEALDLLPEELLDTIENCVVLIEPDPPEALPGILGLYEGIPLTERNSFYSMALPDRIFIFRNPILRMCRSRAQVVHEIRVTVIHEIAHHFGIDDERLHELGYG